MTERQGAFTIPTRLYLTTEHRAQLERLVREQEVDLAEFVSQVVAEYLDRLPPLPDAPAPPEPDHAGDLRLRRSELARLRARRDAAGSQAPAWLHAYIADLEAEIRRLER